MKNVKIEISYESFPLTMVLANDVDKKLGILLSLSIEKDLETKKCQGYAKYEKDSVTIDVPQALVSAINEKNILSLDNEIQSDFVVLDGGQYTVKTTIDGVEKEYYFDELMINARRITMLLRRWYLKNVK